MKKRFLLLTISLSLLLTACGQEPADIGIIGGADGPTAVVVSGSIWPLVIAGFAIGLIAGILWKRKRK